LEDGAISEKVPEEIHLESLPSASPEPQPSERLWPFTNEGVANRFFEDIEDLEKRADERTRTALLLITSDASGVAECCTGLQMPHV
jgi:hypothetical protein